MVTADDFLLLVAELGLGLWLAPGVVVEALPTAVICPEISEKSEL
jgi:hypothetical protein